MSDSKKHHYVPQSLLRGFTPVATGEEKIFVFDRTSYKSWKSSLRNAGSENHFNTILEEEKRTNLEGLFDAPDGLLATLLSEISVIEDLSKLEDQKKMQWAFLIAIQMMRVKRPREIVQSHPNFIRESFANLGFVDVEFPDIDQEAAKRITLESILDTPGFIPNLCEKDWNLYTAPTGSFFISDNPIVVWNEYGRAPGIEEQGMRLSWPLSSKLVLHLACPSISARYAMKDQGAANFLRSQPTIPLPPAYIDQFNRQQAKAASRFLFGPSDNFEFARQALGKNPKPRSSVLSTTQSLNNQNLPPGQWLEVMGHITYHRCRMVNCTKTEGGYSVRVAENDSLELQQAILDVPYSSVEVTADTNSFGMRMVELTPHKNDECLVNVRYLGPGPPW